MLLCHVHLLVPRSSAGRTAVGDPLNIIAVIRPPTGPSYGLSDSPPGSITPIPIPWEKETGPPSGWHTTQYPGSLSHVYHSIMTFEKRFAPHLVFPAPRLRFLLACRDTGLCYSGIAGLLVETLKGLLRLFVSGSAESSDVSKESYWLMCLVGGPSMVHYFTPSPSL